MMELSKQNHELLSARADIYKAWLEQIEKDLQSVLFRSKDLRLDWSTIAQKVERFLDDSFDLSDEMLPELLYRIDLNEFELRQEMESSRWDRWHQLLADAILKREALKVIFRFQYSGKL